MIQDKRIIVNRVEEIGFSSFYIYIYIYIYTYCFPSKMNILDHQMEKCVSYLDMIISGDVYSEKTRRA